ncbi:hypothetical protein PV327_000878 [Microctonus hyperodae]|uniref:GP-PDE domain-containing protein n=1 Tax=Microctonus hyperodae TaxID=165561 RepID=A0AA39G725_MICHY|nr:hypothetical protein PV327_000878 [Microctonus hyperodae]
MTRILINFVLILTIICCELRVSHSRTTHHTIRNTRSLTETLESEDFIQLTDLRRPIIIDQSEIEKDNCAPTCEHFNATKNEAPKNYEGVSLSKCYGWLDSCRRFANKKDEKTPSKYCFTKKERHLIWTDDKSHTTFRNTTEKCIKKSMPSIFPSNVYNHECNICLCMCTEESTDPESITNWAFSLLPQESDIDNDRILTGVRFRTHGKLIHLQIQESQINSDDEDNWKPLSSPENLVLNKDYSLLEPNSRTLNLDVIHVPLDNVITGVRFTRIPNIDKNGWALSMEVQGTKFDKETGKLIKNSNIWYNSNNAPIASANYQRERIEISMDNSISSLFTNDKFYESNTYIKFGPANGRNDTGQYTIPYLSTSNAQTEKTKMLNGIGLTYKKTEGNIGFIKPNIFYYSANNYINGKVELSSIKYDNNEDKSLEETEEYLGTNTMVKDDIDRSTAESLSIIDPNLLQSQESMEDKLIDNKIERPITRKKLSAININGRHSIINKTKQELDEENISKSTTEKSTTEAIAKTEKMSAAFLKHSSNEYSDEEEPDVMESPREELPTEVDSREQKNPIGDYTTNENSEEHTEATTIEYSTMTNVATEESTTITSTDSPIIVDKQTSQTTTVEAITEIISTEDTWISGTDIMKESSETDKIHETTLGDTTKYSEEEKTVMKSTTEIISKEESNIFLKHLNKESATTLSAIKNNVTKVWGSFIVFVIIRIIKNPPPDQKIVNQVLGLDPIKLQTNELSSESKTNGKQFCMKVVAHRGGGYDYPENSLSAFSNSKKKGCNAVEFDLVRTKDNIPIIFHDETIERLTGKSGFIKDMTWDELKQLDIGYNHPLKEKFMGTETIALFNDAIEFCLKNELHLFIDIKDSNIEIVQVILDAYKKYPDLYKYAAITSFYPIIIYMIRRRDRRIITCLSYKPRTFSSLSHGKSNSCGTHRSKNIFNHILISIIDIIHDWALPRFTYRILEISAILLHKDIISPLIINEWNSKGIRVIAWSVNLPSEKMHFTKVLKITYLTDTLLT